ncbi:glycosyltransferase [Lachnospiraceae bacterium JC7]|nr:glycosyltransferase [Lachnospiraceae bacterium JC7]
MNKKKVLLVATIGYFFPQFEMNNISILKSLGYEVHCAADFTVSISNKRKQEIQESGVVVHQIDFTRRPINIFKNIKSYYKLKELIEREQFDLIHCHTPVAGAITRLAAKRCGVKSVIYTAHGFHFYKGSPLKNWMIYYPAEIFCSRFTRVQITINKEDYEIAKAKFHSGEVQYVPGVGISIPEEESYGSIPVSLRDKHSKRDVEKIRKALGVKENEYMVISVGELIERKNHRMIIQALAECPELPVKYFVLGRGTNEDKYKKLIQELHMEEKIHLLGYRDDVMELDRAADLFVFPSYQEGLPLALMEVMKENTPVIASDIRGNRELILNTERLFDPKDRKAFLECFRKALRDLDENCMSEDVRLNRVNLKNYSNEAVNVRMREIYERVLGGIN